MSANFIVYMIGYLLIVAGIAFGMSAAGIDSTWIIVVVLIMAGLGIIYAFGRSQTDEAARSQRSQGSTSGSPGSTSGSPGSTTGTTSETSGSSTSTGSATPGGPQT